MNNSFDMYSIRGTLLTFTTYLVSLMDIELMIKLGVMGIGIASGITTIVYNIKKIKKLNDNEKR
jgi:uncharacterized membrane protein